MKNPKVLFVVPKTKSMFGEEGNIPAHPHVGIAYLTAVLRENHYPVAVFDEGVEKDEAKLFQAVEEFKPGIIGVTSFSYCYIQAYRTIVRLKNRCKKTPLIVGGPHVSATKSSILKETKADFAMAGEGEVSFLKFLEELTRQKPNYAQVPGLIWRQGKKIVENQPADLIGNLDRLPFPDYEFFGLEKYPCFMSKSLPILTSRGCPYGCNYCSVRLSMGRGFRPRSPKNVIAEIAYWYKRGFHCFDINDDCFTLDLERAEKICDLIIKNKLKINLQLYNGIRVDRISPKLLKKLRKAGCSFIAYGCEAGNQETLNRIKKNITLEQVRQAVEWTNKAGIKNAVNFIIGHQGETYRQALDTIEFAQDLPTNFVNFYNLVPYPGTEVYDWAQRYAKFLVPKKTFLKEVSYRDNTPIFETEEFTREQREDIMKKGFTLYERRILQFRLGKPLGLLVYIATRVDFLARFARWLVFSSRPGMKVYQLLSAHSKN